MQSFTKKMLSIPFSVCFALFIATALMFVGCDAAKIKVTFDANGGTFADAKTEIVSELDAGGEIVVPANPTRAKTDTKAYVFAGWDAEIPEQATKDVTFKAKWNEFDRYFAITFDAQNDSANQVQNVEFGQTVALPVVTKDGYTFLGWYDAAEDGNKVTELSATTAKTLYAHWGIAAFDITKVSENGTFSVAESADYTAEVVISDIKPTNGYQFDRAYYKLNNQGAELPISNNKFTMPAGDVTVYVLFKIVTYSIEYDVNGGAELLDPKTSYTAMDEDFTLPTPTKDNYAFAGWIGTDLDLPTKTVTIKKGSSGNKAYTAVWTLANFEVTIVANNSTVTYGGDGITLTATHANVSGLTYTYQWYKGDQKLEGKTAKTLTITNVAESGEYKVDITASDKVLTNTITSTPVTATIKKANPVVVAPTFNVVYDADKTLNDIAFETIESGEWAWEDGTIVPQVGDLSYQATFTPNDTSNYNDLTQDITVNVEKASYKLVGKAEKEIIVKQPLTADFVSVKATYKNADLGGSITSIKWKDVAPDAEGTAIAVVTFTPTDSEHFKVQTCEVTLTVKKISVTFEKENGEQAEIIKVNYDTTASIATPTKESTEVYSYEFLKWVTTQGGETEAVLTNIEADMTVYAIYTETLRTYTATFKKNNGTTYGAYTFDAAIEGEPVLKAEDLEALNAFTHDSKVVDTKNVTFAGNWVYTLSNKDCEFTFDLGNGLEKPFLVDTETFMSLYELGKGEKDYNYKLISDIDFTTLESNFKKDSAFRGVLDGNNKKFYGFKNDAFIINDGAMFATVLGDTVFKNLTIEQGESLVSLVSCARGNSLVFENVTITNRLGSIINMTTDDNNESPFICHTFSAKTSFINCTNNANIDSGAAYFSVFLGGYYIRGTEEPKGMLLFKDCTNTGKIFTTGQLGLLYGNACNFDCEVTIENVVNTGEIVAAKYSNFCSMSTAKITNLTELENMVANKGKVSTLNKVEVATKLVDKNISISSTSNLPEGSCLVDYFTYARLANGSTLRITYQYAINIPATTKQVDIKAMRFVNLSDYTGDQQALVWEKAKGYEYRYAIDNTLNYVIIDNATLTEDYRLPNLTSAENVQVQLTYTSAENQKSVSNFDYTKPAEK